MSEYNIQMNKYNALNAQYDQLYPATKIANVDGLDTALQNKAPAGYGGFGETLPYITAGNNDTDGSKFDALIEAKFATLSNNTTLQLKFDCYPAVSGSVFFGTLWKYSANYGVLTGWSYDGSIIRKVKTGGAWLPFEWVNPPLTIDKEYRTTERYQGKPVYTMLLECGKGPTADGVVQKTSGLPTNVDQFVSVTGSTNLATSLPYVADASGGGAGNFILVGARSGSINIYSKGIDISSQTCYVRLKYTKK